MTNTKPVKESRTACPLCTALVAVAMDAIKINPEYREVHLRHAICDGHARERDRAEARTHRR